MVGNCCDSLATGERLWSNDCPSIASLKRSPEIRVHRIRLDIVAIYDFLLGVGACLLAEITQAAYCELKDFQPLIRVFAPKDRQAEVLW